MAMKYKEESTNMYTARRVSWYDGNNSIDSIVLTKTGEDAVAKFKAHWDVWNNVTDDHDPLSKCFVDETATKPLKCFTVLCELKDGIDTVECLVFTDSHHKLFSCFEEGFSGCSANQINLVIVNNHSSIIL